jgi:uncharacterized protein YndB with AHSA1/START domain
MSTTQHDAHRTTITAPPGQPLVEIVREFDAPPERVYRAHTEPELVQQWLGPRRLVMRIERYEIVRGGSYRYVHVDEDGTEYGFWGVVHDARPGRLITQTFGFDGAPDDPSFDKMTLEPLPNGRTRMRVVSVMHDVAGRDAFLASGMEGGMNESYERLDELLAAEGQ